MARIRSKTGESIKESEEESPLKKKNQRPSMKK